MVPSIDEAVLDHVQTFLGVPAYRGFGAAIYQGDILELCAKLPPSLVRLTVTSPPYNIGKEYETVRGVQEYIDWCAKWCSEVHRLTTDNGAFWLNLGYFSVPGRAKAVPISYLLWDRVPFFLLQEIVWNYGAGVAARHTFSPRNEKFLWYVKDTLNYTFNLDAVRDPDVKYPNQKKNGKLKCNPAGKNPTDVWSFPKVTSGRDRSSVERTPHPAQFPVAVVDRIVKACSNPGDLLLDPFAGSGTVAEVGLRTGRPSLGFELDARYVEIAAQRIEHAAESIRLEQSQVQLFGRVERQ